MVPTVRLKDGAIPSESAINNDQSIHWSIGKYSLKCEHLPCNIMSFKLTSLSRVSSSADRDKSKGTLSSSSRPLPASQLAYKPERPKTGERSILPKGNVLLKENREIR